MSKRLAEIARNPARAAVIVALALMALAVTVVFADASPPFSNVNDPRFEFDANLLEEDANADGALDWDGDDSVGDAGVIEAVRETDGTCTQSNLPAVAGVPGTAGDGLLLCDGSAGNFDDQDHFTKGSKNEGTGWLIVPGSSPKKADLAEKMIYAMFGDSIFDDDDSDCSPAVNPTNPAQTPPALTDPCRQDGAEDFTDVFIYTGLTRLDVNGSTHLDVELNIQDIKRNCVAADSGLSCPKGPERTEGDILIAIDLEKGGIPVQRIFQFQTGSVTCANSPQISPPCFVEITGAAVPPQAAEAKVNSNFDKVNNEAAFEIPAPSWDAVGCERTTSDNSPGCRLRDEIPEAGFMETFIDLSFFGIEAGCPGFSNVVFKTRASNALNSELKDENQGQIEINLCGGLKINKQDDQGNPLPGATFRIFPDPRFENGGTCIPVGESQPVSCLEITDGDGEDDDNANDGMVLIDPAIPGTYAVCELTAPSGYITDASFTCPTTTPVTVTVDAVVVVSHTFVNTLGMLSWEKRDDLNDLQGGAQFSISPNPFACHVPTPGTDPGTFTDNSAPDDDGDAGQIKINRVCLDDYTITEETAPSGFAKDNDTDRLETVSAANANAVIGTALTAPPSTDDPGDGDESDFHNRLGMLSWEKRDDLNDLQGGAQFSISPNPFDCHGGTDPGTFTDNDDPPDKDADDGQIKINRVCLDDYTITEQVAPSGFAKDNDTTRTETVSAGNLNAVIGTALTAPPSTDDPGDGNESDFHNRLGTLEWEKRNGDDNGSLQAGATFSINPNPFSCHTPDPGNPSPISDDDDGTDGNGTDQDGTGGQLKLVRVCLNTYTITEATAPTGFVKDTDTTRLQTVDAGDLNAVIGTQGTAQECPDVTPTDTDEADFCNIQLFKLIILTCNTTTEELVVSSVDPVIPAFFNTIGMKDTIGTPPAGLGKTPAELEAYLCTTLGGVGASYDDLPVDLYQTDTTIPK